MTTKRKIFFVIALLMAALFLFASISAQRPSNNVGEVGVILAGVVAVSAMYAAGFFIAITAMIAFWHYRIVRFGFAAVAALMLIMPAGYAAWHKIEEARHDKFWKDKRANNELAAAKIVARYDKQLDNQGDDIAKLIALRARLQEELYTKELGWSAGGVQDFYWKHSLYIWVFADDSYSADEMAYIKMGYTAPDAVCATFYEEYRSKLAAPEQTKIFRKLCPRAVDD